MEIQAKPRLGTHIRAKARMLRRLVDVSKTNNVDSVCPIAAVHQWLFIEPVQLPGDPPEFPLLIGVDTPLHSDEIHQLLQQGVGRIPAFARLGSRCLTAVEAYILSGKDRVIRVQNSSEPEVRYSIAGFQKLLDPDGYPAVQPPCGTLNAINLDTGKFE